MALSPDGRKLTVSTANSPVQLWDVASGSREWSGSTTFGNTYGARISPDGADFWRHGLNPQSIPFCRDN